MKLHLHNDSMVCFLCVAPSYPRAQRWWQLAPDAARKTGVYVTLLLLCLQTRLALNSFPSPASHTASLWGTYRQADQLFRMHFQAMPHTRLSYFCRGLSVDTHHYFLASRFVLLSECLHTGNIFESLWEALSLACL